MFRLIIKLILIALITLRSVHCHRTEDFSSDDENMDTMNSNSTEGEDNEHIEDDEEEEVTTFLDKFKTIHNLNRNLTIDFNVKHINQTFELINNLSKTLDMFFKTDDRTGLEFMEFLSELDIGLSAQCSSAMFRVYSGFKNSEFWAMKFLDSMGLLPPTGLLEGIQSSFGEFDECLDIQTAKTKDTSVKQFSGKYCLMNAKVPYPSIGSYTDGEPTVAHNQLKASLLNNGLIKLSSVKSLIQNLNLMNGTVYSLGICIPSVCTPEEIEDTINKILYPVTRFPLEVSRTCYIKDAQVHLDKFQLISIIIITFLTLAVITGTCIEVIANRIELESVTTEPSKYVSILLSFSLLKNTRKLFAKNEKFAALDTIRLLMIIQVHLLHFYSYSSSMGLPVMKKIFSDVMHKVYEDNSMVFARTPLPVDVLFTLSGFLLSYGLLRKLDKTNGRFNYVLFIFQRYLRFVVLVFGSILFFYIYPLTGTGPVWDRGVRTMVDGCKNPSNLMKNFLLVNNFDKHGNNFNGDHCHQITWFLAALFQLTVIAPIFIIIYFKKQILGILILILAIILSLFIAIYPLLLFGIQPYLRIWELDSIVFSASQSFAYYHTYPSVSLISFLSGFPFGFMLTKKVRFTRNQEYIFWISSIVSIITVYFSHNSFWHLDVSAPLINILLWLTIGKLLFSFGMGWILYACCTGRAGYLNTLLSWNGFQPIARLSFGIYLLHTLVISHRVFSVKNTFEMSFKYMLEHTVIDIIYDIILAFIFYILIESPLSNIFDLVFNLIPKKQKIKFTSRL